MAKQFTWPHRPTMTSMQTNLPLNKWAIN